MNTETYDEWKATADYGPYGDCTICHLKAAVARILETGELPQYLKDTFKTIHRYSQYIDDSEITRYAKAIYSLDRNDKDAVFWASEVPRYLLIKIRAIRAAKEASRDTLGDTPDG